MFESEIRSEHLQNPNENNLDKQINYDFFSSFPKSADQSTSNYCGISKIADNYEKSSDRLMGFLLKLNYEDLHIATCDPWKNKCGGIPRNSFVIAKLSKSYSGPEDKSFSSIIILARVTDSIPTPLEGDMLNTLFEVHKTQVIPDPYTQKEFQWSGLKASIIGTYYDTNDGKIGFGGDVSTFCGAHAYEVYSPTTEHLEILINNSVDSKNKLPIGKLRYTETPNKSLDQSVKICVNPKDFIGLNSGQRTALFGKTRYGKSNTIKVIADAIMSIANPPGQVIFDPSGEYTYWNEQDNGSLFIKNHQNSIRYSLDPLETPHEKDLNIDPPKLLKVDFYKNVKVGHNLINQLWDSVNPNARPGYFTPILEWDATDPSNAPQKTERSDFEHFWRTLSLWYGVLYLAGFYPNLNSTTRVQFKGPVKRALVDNSHVNCRLNVDGEFDNYQPIENLPSIYRAVGELVDDASFEDISEDYFNDVEMSLLLILKRSRTRTGHNYLRPFARYHDPYGSSIFNEISEYATTGKSVFIEMARADDNIRRVLSENICKQLLNDMMHRFAKGTLGEKFVVLYFEEAHTLFEKDDSDLKNVFNKIAKEGAKFHLSMVYATQSMTTLSPDLLKNTENIFIGHLDDDREIHEVTRKYVFKDLADDIQRINSKGFVRMKTSSHEFALPVQINKFEV